MSILNKFTVKNLKLNKKRTIVTIIGIMLSTALICGVAGLVSSFKASLINWIKVQDGNYHVAFHDIPVEKLKYISKNQKVKDYYLVGDVGWANLEDSTNDYKPYVHILEYDNKTHGAGGCRLGGADRKRQLHTALEQTGIFGCHEASGEYHACGTGGWRDTGVSVHVCVI